MRLIHKLEAGLSGALRLVYQRRTIALLALIIGFAAFVGANMPNLRKDGRVEAFMHESDPHLGDYYDMRRAYGQDNRLVVSVTAPDVFTTPFLTKFARLHDELADHVPYVAEIFSIYNMPFMQNENSGLYFEELGRNILARGRDPAELRARIMATPLYKNFIISEDGRTVAIVLEPYRYAPHESDCVPDPANGVRCPARFVPAAERELLGAPHYREMTLAARKTATAYEADDFQIHIAGSPVVSTEIVAMMSRDMPRFTLMSVLIAAASMLVIFRSGLVALGSLLTFLTALFGTLSTLSLTGGVMTPPSQLLIPLTLVVSLCSYIHFMCACLRAGAQEPDRLTALGVAIRQTRAPILFTALTTAGGMLAMLSSPLAPIATLGAFGALATGLAFLLALIWGAIVFRTLPQRFLARRSEKPGLPARVMAACADWAAARPIPVLAAAALIVGVSILGAARLQHSHNSLLWLPPENPARISTEHIDARFNGTVNLEVVISPEGGRDMRDADLLQTVETTARAVSEKVDIPIGRHTSMISFIEEANQALRGGDPAERRVPGQEAVWDQTLMLESQGLDDMRRYVSLNYDEGRVSFLTPWLEATRYASAIEAIRSDFQRALGDSASVETTGLIALLARTSAAVLDSMSESYLIALALVTTLMCVFMGGARLGLVSMAPNLAPFVMLLGVMGFTGSPLDTFTVLIGAIITGLIVDDTVHFFHAAKRRLANGEDSRAAGAEAARDVGDALFSTTVVVMLSFAVFMFSSMSNVRAFGMLMSLGALFALLADLFLGPALLTLLSRKTQAPAAPRVPRASVLGGEAHA